MAENFPQQYFPLVPRRRRRWRSGPALEHRHPVRPATGGPAPLRSAPPSPGRPGARRHRGHPAKPDRCAWPRRHPPALARAPVPGTPPYQTCRPADVAVSLSDTPSAALRPAVAPALRAKDGLAAAIISCLAGTRLPRCAPPACRSPSSCATRAGAPSSEGGAKAAAGDRSHRTVGPLIPTTGTPHLDSSNRPCGLRAAAHRRAGRQLTKPPCTKWAGAMLVGLRSVPPAALPGGLAPNHQPGTGDRYGGCDGDAVAAAGPPSRQASPPPPLRSGPGPTGSLPLPLRGRLRRSAELDG